MILMENMKKLTTNFETVKDEDIINKSYTDGNLSKIKGRLSFLDKDYIEFKLQYNKQTVDEILIQRAVKTTIQIFYDKCLFDKYADADKGLEDFLFVTRRRGVNLEESKWWGHSMILIKNVS